MKNAKSFVLIGLVAALSISLAACGGKAKDSGTILIGGALCLTGIQAPLDEPAVRGAQLAVDELNKKGGVLGKKLEFTNLDGKSDPVTVGNVAVELIKKGAKAIIAPSDFDFGGPASREAQKAGIVGISPGRLLSPLRVQDARRQAVHHVDVEHHHGSRHRGVRLQPEGVEGRLRGDRHLHRLHEVPQPLLHPALQEAGR